ncbi:unnamed protein product [Pylaiella littoralis]
MMGVTTEDRAADATIESRLERKVVHLDNVPAVWQTEAQRAGARAGAGRAAGNPARCGLSGKRCKEMGLNALETRGGGSLPFRDLLGLHGVWKYYAARLVSRCGRNQKLLQQRILSADLQGCYLTVCRASASSLVGVAGIVVRETSKTFQLVTPQGKTKTVPKRSCAVRLVLGGRVVNLNGRALESRFAGAGGKQQAGRNRNSAAPGAGVGADDSPADPPCRRLRCSDDDNVVSDGSGPPLMYCVVVLCFGYRSQSSLHEQLRVFVASCPLDGCSVGSICCLLVACLHARTIVWLYWEL